MCRANEAEKSIADPSTWKQGKPFGPACQINPHLDGSAVLGVNWDGIPQFNSEPHDPLYQTADCLFAAHRVLRGYVVG